MQNSPDSGGTGHDHASVQNNVSGAQVTKNTIVDRLAGLTSGSLMLIACIGVCPSSDDLAHERVSGLRGSGSFG